MQFVKPLPFAEALEKLGQRVVVASKLDSEGWSQLPLALRERAFWSATIESVRVLQGMRGGIDDFLSGARETLPNGEVALKSGSRAEFVKQFAALAEAEGVGPADPDDVGGLKDIRSEARLSLIWRTQVEAAQAYGTWKQGQDPDVLNEFPAQRFIREQEVKQPRPVHQMNIGVVRLKSDLDFWMAMNDPSFGGFGVPWGPWGFNSGMGVEDVDRDEAERLGLIAAGERAKPVDKDFNDRLEASARGIDGDLIDVLKQEFGDQLSVEGDRLKWRGGQDGSSERAEPEPEPAETKVERKSPVSKALEVLARGSLRQQVLEALVEMDKVHDDGRLDPIGVTALNKSHFGEMKYSPIVGQFKAMGLAVNPKGPWPQLTMVHEAGHLLDLEAIGTKGEFATAQGHGGMLKVLQAIESSATVRAMRSAAALDPDDDAMLQLDYLLDARELWARAYAQFVAKRSGSAVLARNLETMRAMDSRRVWSVAEWAAIETAIEQLFQELGWL